MATGSNNGNLEVQTRGIDTWSGSISMNSTPSVIRYGSGIRMFDSEHKRIFHMIPIQYTDGKIGFQMYAARTVNNAEKYNGINVCVNPDGTFEDSFINTDSSQAFLNMLDSGWANVPAGADYDSGTLTYRRFGRIVTVEGQTLKLKTSTVTAGNRGTAGTLPTGFRPSKTAYGGAFYGFHVSDLIEIGTDGSISIQTPANWSGGGCWFTVTFLTT